MKRIYIPLPSNEARKQIIESTLRREHWNINAEQLGLIVSQSEGMTFINKGLLLKRILGYSGADVTNLCKEAAMGPVRNVPVDMLAKISLHDVLSLLSA